MSIRIAFPGPIKIVSKRKRVLNDEQVAWLAKYYPKTENAIVAKAMGISETTMRELAKEHGITKSKAGMKAIRKRQQRRAAKTNHKNGCYDRKRGHPCSEATMEGNRRRWEETRQGLRDNPMLSLLKKDPVKYQEAMEKKSQERRTTIHKEKLRVIYGLPRKTRLKAVVMKPFTMSQLHHRCKALKLGYLLDEDCSEGQPGRYVIYYDSETKRSPRFEQNCINDGFTIAADN